MADAVFSGPSSLKPAGDWADAPRFTAVDTAIEGVWVALNIPGWDAYRIKLLGSRGVGRLISGQALAAHFTQVPRG